MILFLLALGSALLYAGAELLVRGGAGLALRMGISPLVVGLTVIAFGTSSPELVVSFRAAMAQEASIALGNVIGSNIANIALVLGLAACVRPIRVERQVIRREIPVMLCVSFLLGALLWNRRLDRIDGTVLFTLLIGYVGFSIWSSRRENATAEIPPHAQSLAWSVAGVVVGLALLVPGAKLFVAGATALAAWLGLSTFVIGLTVVAIGTSLPEIATSLVAASRGEGDLAVGNAVGSNIFNILFVLGFSALFFVIDGGQVRWGDLAMMWAVALVSLPVMWTGFVIDRLEGMVLVLSYLAYLGYRLW